MGMTRKTMPRKVVGEEKKLGRGGLDVESKVV